MKNTLMVSRHHLAGRVQMILVGEGAVLRHDDSTTRLNREETAAMLDYCRDIAALERLVTIGGLTGGRCVMNGYVSATSAARALVADLAARRDFLAGWHRSDDETFAAPVLPDTYEMDWPYGLDAEPETFWLHAWRSGRGADVAWSLGPFGQNFSAELSPIERMDLADALEAGIGTKHGFTVTTLDGPCGGAVRILRYRKASFRISTQAALALAAWLRAY